MSAPCLDSSITPLERRNFCVTILVFVIMRRRQRRSTSTFSCGHPRTVENTRIARGRGYSWGKCRICDNRYMRAYMKHQARMLLRRQLEALSRARAKPRQPEPAETRCETQLVFPGMEKA